MATNTLPTADTVWTNSQNFIQITAQKIKAGNIHGNDWIAFPNALGYAENGGNFGGFGGSSNLFAGMYQVGNPVLNDLGFYTGIIGKMLGIANDGAVINGIKRPSQSFADNPLAQDLPLDYRDLSLVSQLH